MNKAKKKESLNIHCALLNLGYNNYIVIDRVVAILSPDSLPMKRLKEDAKERKLLIDVTQGRKTRSIVLCDTNHIFLSSMQPDTLLQRINPADVKDIEATSDEVSS